MHYVAVWPSIFEKTLSNGLVKSAYSKLFGCDEDGCVITPRSAYMMWFLRDVTAWTFILTLPPVISSTLGIHLALSYFVVPILGQFFTTPLHLLGFSMCNRPEASKSAGLPLTQARKRDVTPRSPHPV